MKNYQVYIDVPQDENWDEIDVEEMEVEAFNCNDARRIATLEAETLYGECYVWEVTEEDIID